jgi:hypothetical protein
MSNKNSDLPVLIVAQSFYARRVFLKGWNVGFFRHFQISVFYRENDLPSGGKKKRGDNSLPAKIYADVWLFLVLMNQ